MHTPPSMLHRESVYVTCEYTLQLGFALILELKEVIYINRTVNNYSSILPSRVITIIQSFTNTSPITSYTAIVYSTPRVSPVTLREVAVVVMLWVLLLWLFRI